MKFTRKPTAHVLNLGQAYLNKANERQKTENDKSVVADHMVAMQFVLMKAMDIILAVAVELDVSDMLHKALADYFVFRGGRLDKAADTDKLKAHNQKRQEFSAMLLDTFKNAKPMSQEPLAIYALNELAAAVAVPLILAMPDHQHLFKIAPDESLPSSLVNSVTATLDTGMIPLSKHTITPEQRRIAVDRGIRHAIKIIKEKL